MGDPWRLTLRQFLEKVEQEYGSRPQEGTLWIRGARGTETFKYLGRTVTIEQFAVLQDLDPDVELSPHVLRSLCNQIGVPPEDFGLDPDFE